MSSANELGWLKLHDGAVVRFRPVVPQDERLVLNAVATASPQTLLQRFFIPLRGIAPEELRRLLAISPEREFCLVGETGEGRERRIICGARYVRLNDPSKAEIAITVHDTFQRQGLGLWMLRKLADVAWERGIHTFVAHVLADNRSMLGLIRRLAPRRRVQYHGGECEIEFELSSMTSQAPDSRKT